MQSGIIKETTGRKMGVERYCKRKNLNNKSTKSKRGWIKKTCHCCNLANLWHKLLMLRHLLSW